MFWAGAVHAEEKASAAKGSIAGVVKYALVKKYPTVVYIEEMPGKQFQAPSKQAVMNQKSKTFVPRVLPVVVGTTVRFKNSDDFDHNVSCPDGEGYNLGNWGKGQEGSYTFSRTGAHAQLCKLHPEMIAYVVVLKTPYFAVADEQGRFSIPDVSVGFWKLKIWNERVGGARRGA